MADEKENQPSLPGIDLKQAPKPLAQSSVPVDDQTNKTHEAVAETMQLDFLDELGPREGKPITEMGQVNGFMTVTFIHPETRKLTSGRIFDDDSQSQAYESSGKEDSYYLCVSGGGPKDRWNLFPWNIKKFKIYEIYEV